MYLILLIRVKIAEVLIVLAFPNKKKVKNKNFQKLTQIDFFASYLLFIFIL